MTNYTASTEPVCSDRKRIEDPPILLELIEPPGPDGDTIFLSVIGSALFLGALFQLIFGLEEAKLKGAATVAKTVDFLPLLCFGWLPSLRMD